MGIIPVVLVLCCNVYEEFGMLQIVSLENKKIEQLKFMISVALFYFSFSPLSVEGVEKPLSPLLRGDVAHR